MTRVRNFFLREATECLDVLRAELRTGTPDATRAHRAARLLRGSAQMARFGALAREAEALERRLKAVSRGEAAWSRMDGEAARAQLAVLERAVDAVGAGRVESDARTETAMDGEQGGGAQVVPIEELEYSGRAALERALELRSTLEDAIVAEEPVGPLLEELFDLVRLGMR